MEASILGAAGPVLLQSFSFLGLRNPQPRSLKAENFSQTLKNLHLNAEKQHNPKPNKTYITLLTPPLPETENPKTPPKYTPRTLINP